MASWDIHYDSVVHTLSAASTEAQQYAADTQAIQSALNSLGSSLPNSECVAASLNSFVAKVVTPQLETVIGRTASALQGTSDAVVAYHQGDSEMAMNAQHKAALATYPEPETKRASPPQSPSHH